MMMTPDRMSGPPVTRLSDEMDRLAGLCGSEQNLTLGEFLDQLPTRSNSLLSFVLALPFMLPIPVPGLSILFGLIIFIAGTCTAFGRGPWLPGFWRRRPLPAATLLRVLKQGRRIIERVERVARPRGAFMVGRGWTNALSGAMIAICGLLLSAPLPPGTNFPPGIAVLLLSTANLERDGLFLVLGTFAFVVNCAFFTALFMLGFEGVKALLF